MKVFTNTNLVKKARESVLEFLLVNHPLDCPICDQGGECDLQDQTIVFGSDRGRFFETKRAVKELMLGPVIKTFMSRCIHCTRCVRFSREILGSFDLGLIGRGNNTRISTFVNQSLRSYLAGNLVDICPVGALTSKPFAFTARPWELKAYYSVDTFDGLGSNIKLDVRGSEIMRILPSPRNVDEIPWISDKSRLYFDGLYRQRVSQISVNTPVLGDGINGISWGQVFFLLVAKYSTFFGFYSVMKAFDLKSYSFGANFCIKSGSNIDVDSVVQLGKFQNIFGVDFKFQFTFRSEFSCLENFLELKQLKNKILLGLSAETENPVIATVLLSSFNQSVSYTLAPFLQTSCLSGGISMSSVVQFVKGRSSISRLSASLKISDFCLLVGGSFLSRFDYFAFKNCFDFVSKPKSFLFRPNFFLSNSTQINKAELNALPECYEN